MLPALLTKWEGAYLVPQFTHKGGDSCYLLETSPGTFRDVEQGETRHDPNF